MGLEWGGFILMTSHCRRVAILGYIGMRYYHYFAFPTHQSRKQNKQNKTARGRGKKERRRNKNRTGEKRNIQRYGALK